MEKRFGIIVIGLIFVLLFGCIDLGGTDSIIPEHNDNLNIIKNGNIMGNPNASVTIIEYSDFQCGFCGKFYKETMPLIEENYIATGKVKLEFRHFAIPDHPYSQKAAEATECANDQGKFWEMHDIIFENQASLSLNSFKTFAEILELDTKQFNECFDSDKYKSKVDNSFNEGKLNGVGGTPTFFVNGQKISGAKPYEVFVTVIESKLEELK